MDIHVGDVIEINSNQVGAQVRRGSVKALLSEQPLELAVAWDDGHESNIYPAGGMVRVVDRGADAS